MLFASALPSARAEAKGEAWNLLWKTLEPLAAMLTDHPLEGKRAIEARFECVEAPGFPKGFPGSEVEVVFQPPDRAMVRVKPGPNPPGVLQGAFLAWWEKGAAVGRKGQTLWAYPGSLAEGWLRTMAPLPKPDKKFRFQDFRVPIPAKQLVFLPALLEMEDLGENGDGRKLRIRLIPEVREQVGTGNGFAEVTMAEDGSPARIAVEDGDFRVGVKVLAWKYSGGLPDTAFLPGESDTDVLRVNAAQFSQIAAALKRR